MADLKSQDKSQIEKLVAEKRESLRVLRFNRAGSRNRNVRQGRMTRKEIARALTELSSRKNAEKVALKPKKA